jgi:hypothetical protein
MRYLFILWILVWLSGIARAQKIITVTNRKHELAVKAQVYINGRRDFAFLNGQFRIGNAQTGTIRIASSGYEEWQGRMEDLVSGDTIKLDTISRYLKEVKIEGKKIQSDSASIRKEFKKDFEYKPFKFHKAFTLTTINVDILYGSLSKKNRRLKKFKKKLAADERKYYVERIFNPELVSSVTGLKGDELISFMIKYMPEFNQVMNMSPYELNIYIKDAINKEY